MTILQHADTLYINGIKASAEDREALIEDIRRGKAKVLRQPAGLNGRKLVVHAEVER